MKTFKGSKKQKKELLNKLKHHQDLDTFIQGKWLDVGAGKVEGNGFKGCFYGCTMQTEDEPIKKFSEEYNIDLWYCYLTEKLFEGLPYGEYQSFPYKSIEVLPVGIDVNKVKSLFHYKVLENQLQFCKENKRTTDALKRCMELFKTPFYQIEESAAWAAAEAAEAVRPAAWSARAAAEAARAARPAAWSAAWAARAAAEAAAEAARAARPAAWSARAAAGSATGIAESARSNYYIFLKDTLFNCIKEVYKQ